MNLTLGLLIPFVGTTLGAAMVFFMRNKMNKKIEKLLLGFASGVMIAASIWSLILPAIEMSEEQGKIAWLPATLGFLFGIVFLLVLDSLIPHLHLHDDKPEGVKSKLKKTTMLVLAVTLHNIPERNGSWCNVCRSINWKCWNNNGGCVCFGNRNCYTEFSGGGNYFYAIKV